MQCSGSEYNLTECEIRNDRDRTSHSFDVGVKCQPGRLHISVIGASQPKILGGGGLIACANHA